MNIITSTYVLNLMLHDLNYCIMSLTDGLKLVQEHCGSEFQVVLFKLKGTLCIL